MAHGSTRPRRQADVHSHGPRVRGSVAGVSVPAARLVEDIGRSHHRRQQVEHDLESRGDPMSIAPRVMIKFPSGSTWASTNDWDGHFDLVVSRELNQAFEMTGMAGAVLRGDPD